MRIRERDKGGRKGVEGGQEEEKDKREGKEEGGRKWRMQILGCHHKKNEILLGGDHITGDNLEEER